MIVNTISRRRLLKTGASTLAGALSFLRVAGALDDKSSALTPFTFPGPQSATGDAGEKEASNTAREDIIRKYYSGWEKKEWSTIDSVLADSFTFTSPNDDDHIDKRAFKARCWGQAKYIERFDLESVLGSDNEAFVKYLCRTTQGTRFRNIDYFRLAGGRIGTIEVYFGGRLGYPTASISGKP
jgi:SnoaL-like domain